MEVYEAESINDVYPYIIEDVKKAGDKVVIERPDAVDNFTAEMRPLIINVKDPRRRLVSSRPVNVPFMLAEVLWIISGRRDVEMLQAYNSRISSFSDDGVLFNAAYGHRLRTAFGHDQIEDVIRTLLDDPSSRQGTMVISNPVDDKGWDRYLAESTDTPEMIFKKKVTKDRACNVMSHVLLRNGRLDWLQVVRSNDLVWGLPYNWMQFTHLQEYIAYRLVDEGLTAFPGEYTHVIHSAHIYGHHFNEQVPLFDLYRELDWQHPAMWTKDEVINLVLREEQVGRQRGPEHMEKHIDAIGGYWNSVLWVLRAGLHFKAKEDSLALDALHKVEDPVLALTTLRFFFSVRWHKTSMHSAAKTAAERMTPPGTWEAVSRWIGEVPRAE